MSTRSAVTVAMMITGFATAALSGAGAAAADPMSDLEPLLSSSCSFTQIDAALHDAAPDTAAQLDAAPAQKAALKTAYDRPVAERRAAFQALITQQQQMGVTATDNADFGPKMTQVVGSCHQY
ncbi:hemophore-related protein [Nocardia sp. NPDC059240]|uniref:hemophore-related protein n=1 Tax=Nocardia sp. NPDC059240 TaxID=3346786 RepID=UPI00367A9BB7